MNEHSGQNAGQQAMQQGAAGGGIVGGLGTLGNVGLGDSWAHRTKGMRCRTCMWFVVKQTNRVAPAPNGELGRCRRHCPTMNGFPAVFELDWCGDHKLDETKV